MRLSRRSEYGLRALVDLVRHEGEGPIALATLASRTACRSSSSSRSWPRSSTAASSGRRSEPTAATRWRPTRRRVSIGRVIRLLDGALAPLRCVSLRYYEPCSCPDEATCSLRDAMIDVRDAMLEILDNETLADSPPPGPRLDRPARPPRRRPGRPDDPDVASFERRYASAVTPCPTDPHRDRSPCRPYVRHDHPGRETRAVDAASAIRDRPVCDHRRFPDPMTTGKTHRRYSSTRSSPDERLDQVRAAMHLQLRPILLLSAARPSRSVSLDQHRVAPLAASGDRATRRTWWRR